MHTYNTKLLSFIVLSIIGLFGSCKQTTYNGSYCAKVNYYNNNTGTFSEYTLYAEVENNILKEIKFPSGYLNQDHFGNVMISQEGEAVIELEENQEYSVKITGDMEHCLKNVAKAVQCKGITRTGQICRNLTDNPSGFCWHHNK